MEVTGKIIVTLHWLKYPLGNSPLFAPAKGIQPTQI